MQNHRSLDDLRPIAEECLAGLQTDGPMMYRILSKARHGKSTDSRTMVRRTVRVGIAVCAALAVFIGVRGSSNRPVPVQIESVAAGGTVEFDSYDMEEEAPMSSGLTVSLRSARVSANVMQAGGERDIPLVMLNSGVYRMMEEPAEVEASLLGERIGEVEAFEKEPSMAMDGRTISNVCDTGADIYTVNDLDENTAIVARTNGVLRLFQRVSYAGRGPGGLGLEDTFDVRGRVESLTLGDGKTISGEIAEQVADVLLDTAYLQAADAMSMQENLVVTLKNGLTLQLGIDGENVVGCGVWSSPEFFEAFRNAQESRTE